MEGMGNTAEKSPQQELKELWESKKAEEQKTAVEAADSIHAVGSALFAGGIEGVDGRTVCGESFGQFETADWDRLKPILENWSYIEGDGGEQSQEMYANQKTLLEEFPGDDVRRKLDQLLRSYLKIDGE